MLTDLCQELHNWFEVEKHTGEFTITEGVLAASFLQPGQYFRVIGSVFNDGVWSYGENGDKLADETFEGTVWALAIPRAVLSLNTEIEAWITKYGNTISSPFSGESLSATSYSYSKASGENLQSMTWQKVFSQKLRRWRKL